MLCYRFQKMDPLPHVGNSGHNMADSMEITKSLLGFESKAKDKSYARLKDCENMMLQVKAIGRNRCCQILAI